MRSRIWNAVETYLAESVLEHGVSLRRAIPHACLEFYDAPVPYLTLALSSMAVELDQLLPSKSLNTRSHSREVHDAIVAVVSDLALAEILEIKITTFGDLLAYWKNSNEKYFIFESNV